MACGLHKFQVKYSKPFGNIIVSVVRASISIMIRSCLNLGHGLMSTMLNILKLILFCYVYSNKVNNLWLRLIRRQRKKAGRANHDSV